MKSELSPSVNVVETTADEMNFYKGLMNSTSKPVLEEAKIYDMIMTRLGVLEDGEHWNEDCYQDHGCDH